MSSAPWTSLDAYLPDENVTRRSLRPKVGSKRSQCLVCSAHCSAHPSRTRNFTTPEVKALDIDTLRIFETFYPELDMERGRAGRRGVRSRHILSCGEIGDKCWGGPENGWHELTRVSFRRPLPKGMRGYGRSMQCTINYETDLL